MTAQGRSAAPDPRQHGALNRGCDAEHLHRHMVGTEEGCSGRDIEFYLGAMNEFLVAEMVRGSYDQLLHLCTVSFRYTIPTQARRDGRKFI